ncbi:beta-lactamase hydrolase domain-containing protein [Yoonia rosea]|uniref:beta-lactamase hydrolase domain-containing protein n=1 Tax=Yoonia rosea TaxID=287098 RepID=UPI0009FF3AD9|nr:sulfur transferase domain-containing protein [Yoonia rosea]
MDIKPLTAGLCVSPQIRPDDMQAIKDAGFRANICNRPDGVRQEIRRASEFLP